MYKQIEKLTAYILLLATSSFPALDTAVTVDTTIIITADFTADSIPDSLFCRLTGKSWKKPLLAMYTVKSKNKVIFSKTYNDNLFDEEFAYNDGLDWCDGGYLECKEKWYFDIMQKMLIKYIPLKDKKRKKLFDTSSIASIPRILEKRYIDSLHFSPEKAAVEAKKGSVRFKKRDFSCLVLPLHPLYSSYPMLFDPKTRRFITLIGY